jgi:hypothetical protein
MKVNAANADMYASIATVMQPKPDLVLQFSASTKKKKEQHFQARRFENSCILRVRRFSITES